ncbi:MAG: UDP-N-acetylmuramoyl-tripeptide--D-alanyl-D-alanine ligase, partial [Gammaproteobacteria bacterium]
SCGKTTTKQMMNAIFSKAGPTHSAVGSFNNHVGVPVTLLGLSQEHRYAVIEMGANHPHEISPLTQMAKPDVAIITIVAPVHTEGFGDVDTIAKTKAEIFEGLGPKGVAIINQDDHYFSFWQQLLKHQPVLRFSSQTKADVFATDIRLEFGCPVFMLNTPKGKIEIQLPILGRHNVINALAAASAAIALDIPLPLIAEGLAHMQPAKHRLHVCKGINGATIIDDAYNANPLAVKAALDILAGYQGEKVWVFFDMKELGKLAHEAHQEVGQIAREKGINRIFAVGEHARITVNAFGEGAQFFANKADLIHALKPQLHKNMTILIKGSRSGALEEVVKALME